jgi:hypothetical protein
LERLASLGSGPAALVSAASIAKAQLLAVTGLSLIGCKADVAGE